MVGGSLWGLLTSSTTKTGRHDIAEILRLNTINQIKSIHMKLESVLKSSDIYSFESKECLILAKNISGSLN
jgi:hypothetical protein